jgi:hypothetical protein
LRGGESEGGGREWRRVERGRGRQGGRERLTPKIPTAGYTLLELIVGMNPFITAIKGGATKNSSVTKHIAMIERSISIKN